MEAINTKFLGQNLITLEEIDSTQKYIKNIAEEAENGLVVIAENQVAGIGTKGSTWYTTKKKNLTFSFLLKPNCNVKKIENLTIMIANVIVDIIKELYNISLDIKYPNDIMLNGKKLGGILTEATTVEENVKQIIVGIGINVNQENFCEEIENIATSLKKEFKKDFDKNKIFAKFLTEFEKRYIELL